jgi:uroporphyrin-III C-methyltransferase
MTNETGKVYLVGAGPGAPDLLTLRAAKILASADIVFYDALVHPETVALAENARKVAVGKRVGQVSTDQRFINRSLVEAARGHKIVVRLKGGDPMLFGRAQEEITALQDANIEFEIVPGITAALAASAALKQSLTQRGIARSVTFATPRIGPNEVASDWQNAVENSDTAVLYMASRDSANIAKRLIKSGKAPNLPVVIVENISLPNEQQLRMTLNELANSVLNFDGPAVLCVGEVFALNKVLNIDVGVSAAQGLGTVIVG